MAEAAGHPELFPLVVVRCADWADPVRSRARALLAEILDAGTAVTLAPMILRVADRYRGDHALGLLDGVLRQAPRERLAPLLVSGDRTVRRFAYRMAVEEGALSPVELARAAAEDDDAVIQGRCAEAALAAGPGAEALDVLLGGRNPQARSAGVTALRRLGHPERAVEFLADRSALVRACARYVVRQHGIDPLAWYRARCAEPAPPPGAVIGLAECGDRADAPLLWALLEHPAPGVRARAVAGLRALDVTDVRRLRPLLDDPAPGVVGEATLALLPSARELPEEWLLSRLDAGRPRWERVSAWRLLNAHGDVARLRAAVPLLGDADVRLRAWAEHAVQRELRRVRYEWRGQEIAALLDQAEALRR
ncbi:hypothetical protein [Streptomyces sp. NPDC002176]|uniref:hypothetical protein n=1 Tax=Streptomyces sp. NPDC002176 TaxID=3364634 RepID=UPI00384BD5B5